MNNIRRIWQNTSSRVDILLLLSIRSLSSSTTIAAAAAPLLSSASSLPKRITRKDFISRCANNGCLFSPRLSFSYTAYQIIIGKNFATADIRGHMTRKMATVPPGADNLENKLTVDVLNLEELDNDLFRGTHLWKPPFARAVFGGQVVGQALVASASTVPENVTLHSMHCYFVRAGDPSTPIIYQVDRTRDGRSFSTRVVRAIQRGRPILTLGASYHNELEEEAGPLEFQMRMPDVVSHTELRSMTDLLKYHLESENLSDKNREIISRQLGDDIPIEIKPVDPKTWFRMEAAKQTRSLFWVKAAGKIGENQNLHRCVAAYISDWALLWTALACNPEIKPVMMASLDHSMWFHSAFEADQWMLYECESNVAKNNRAHVNGKLWKEDGTLAVTISQEGIVRSIVKSKL